MSQKQDELSVTETTEEQKGETSIEEKTEEKIEEKTTETEEELEQTVDPEKLKQQLNTQTGLLKQAQAKLKELEKRHLDFGEVKTSITGIASLVQEQGVTLNLVTDVLSQMNEGNEELQAKVKASQEARETTQKQVAQAQTAYADIISTLQLVEIDPDGEEAKPAREAFNARDYPKAKELAKLAVTTKVSALKLATPADEDKGDKEKVDEKGKQKVITKTSAAAPDWRDLSPKDKIKSGVEEAKKNQ